MKKQQHLKQLYYTQWLQFMFHRACFLSFLPSPCFLSCTSFTALRRLLVDSGVVTKSTTLLHLSYLYPAGDERILLLDILDSWLVCVNIQ